MTITPARAAAVIGLLLIGASAQACQAWGPSASSRPPFAPRTADPDNDNDVDLRGNCAAPSQPGWAACMAIRVTDMDTYVGPDPPPDPFRFSPARLQRVYGLDASPG